MNTFFKSLLILIFFLISIDRTQAQTIGETKLDQIELMKQFVGRWKCELGKDTVVIGENIAFGTGLVCNS